MEYGDYTLYKRYSKKKGKPAYYVQFYKSDGKRLAGRSSGQTSESAARRWAREQVNKGIISTDKYRTFGEFTRDWWIWDKCLYVRMRRAKGSTISPAYANTMRSYLKNHLWPTFENIRLENITTKMIEEWHLQLSEGEKPLSYATANHCLKCMKVICKMAKKWGYITQNPAEDIEQLKSCPKERGILKTDEIKELFRKDNIEEVWNNDLLHYTLNLTAASTGARMGELQGLQVQYVHDEYIEIIQSWDRRYGLKEPKWGSVRETPIPSKTADALHTLINLSPYKEPEDFVFFGEDSNKPVNNKTILKHLYMALGQIGITNDERKNRNICFHSWRHLYNTMLRGKVPDAKLRVIVGHKTMVMQDKYTHFRIEDFRDVQEVQEQVFQP